MVDTAQPLNQLVPIVNPDGTPTDYFIRMMRDFSENAVNNEEADAWEVQGGVGIDGGGPVSEGVTLDANEQEILDELGTDQGSIIFRGATDWELLAPGTSGQFLKTNGASNDPEWAAAGGGSSLTPPTASMFSITLNAPTVVDTSTYMAMTAATGAPTIRGLLNTLPGGNFDVIVKRLCRNIQNFNGSGIIFRDTGGKYIHVGTVHNGGFVLVCDQFNSSTSFNSGAGSVFFSGADDTPSWVKASFNATTNDVQCYFSFDGVVWEGPYATSTFLGTCDAFGIGCVPNGSAMNAFFQHYEVV